MSDYKTIDQCRACSDHNLTPLFSLGSQYVSDFVGVGHIRTGNLCPIDVVLCNGCALVQLKHTAPQDFLYTRHYWYRSGVTRTMCLALADIAASAQGLVRLGTGDVVLDIGSNDGTLLRSYTEPVVRVGVEPADNLAQEGAAGIDQLIHAFWDFNVYYDQIGKLAKVVTAIGMFYDLDDPNQFIADIASALHKDGLFIAQLMTLRNTINKNDVGNFCHEHLEFYSYKSLSYLFEKHGLEIIDVQTNDVNGQSDRYYVRHRGGSLQPEYGAAERIANIKAREVLLDNPKLYTTFFQGLEYNKKRVHDFVEYVNRMDKMVWVYGASTKGNVILQYYGLDSTIIQGAAERSPSTCGKFTVGTGIPIYDEDTAREHADYFLILPYAFTHEFLEREKKWRDAGGKFIVPLPEMVIL